MEATQQRTNYYEQQNKAKMEPNSYWEFTYAKR